MTKNYRTFSIQGSTAFAKGKKMYYPSASTIDNLKALGVHEIVWSNGDFLRI